MELLSDEFATRLTQSSGYGLTTAEILYNLPDHPEILQSYVWQDYDTSPSFPALNRFLAFWRDTLDGAVHSVRVGHAKLVRPVELRAHRGRVSPALASGALTSAAACAGLHGRGGRR